MDCKEIGKVGFEVSPTVRTRGQRWRTRGPPPPLFRGVLWTWDAKHCFLIRACVSDSKSERFTGFELVLELPPPLDRRAQCFLELVLILALKASNSLSALARMPGSFFLGQTIALAFLSYHIWSVAPQPKHFIGMHFAGSGLSSFLYFPRVLLAWLGNAPAWVA